MSSADVLLDNYARGKQTFIIPLTFTDINDAKDIITDISYGGDIWEARIDLLSPDGPNIGAVNLPPLDYVRAQIKALQAMSALPILFTIRTRSQGGKFPDGASKEALALMLLAVECGVHYIDVEVEWPQSLVQKLQAGKGDAQIVASYHSWTGEIRWTSDELLQRQKAAEEFGGTFPGVSFLSEPMLV
jgi:3-dehydroquinate dehydratase type I